MADFDHATDQDRARAKRLAEQAGWRQKWRMIMQTHFQDPCIHCGQAMEAVEVGACPGDTAKAVAIAYRSLGTRWDGYEHFLLRLSTN